jgi:hypothetical protein
MTDDQLLEAARALRLARGGASETARFTEEQIMRRVGQSAHRKRRLYLLLPIAAVLAVSSAWAASAGHWTKLGMLWQQIAGRTPAAESASHKHAAATASATPTPIAPLAPANAAPAPLTASSSASAARTASSLRSVPPAPVPSARAVLDRPAAPSASPPDAVVTPSALDLYQRAHELHFRKHDPAAALSAWNEYLAIAPSGALALEARYNRAICLVELGRRDEAREALLPFARGDYGGYRQAEANALLNGNAAPR